MRSKRLQPRAGSENYRPRVIAQLARRARGAMARAITVAVALAMAVAPTLASAAGSCTGKATGWAIDYLGQIYLFMDSHPNGMLLCNAYSFNNQISQSTCANWLTTVQEHFSHKTTTSLMIYWRDASIVCGSGFTLSPVSMVQIF